MPEWLFWFLIGVGFIAFEVLIAFTLYAGAMAMGAFPAALAAALGASLELQVGIFAVGAAFSLLVLRPIARRQLRIPERIRTGADALIGARATVTDRVDYDRGTVKIHGGDIWSARALESGKSFEPGDEVVVRRIKGVSVLVSAPESDE